MCSYWYMGFVKVLEHPPSLQYFFPHSQVYKPTLVTVLLYFSESTKAIQQKYTKGKM